MRRRTRHAPVLAALLALAAPGCKQASAPAAAKAARAARGEKEAGAAATAKRPRRIITLTPSATELVADIAGARALVGVDKYSSYPPAVKSLPRVGDFLHPSFETILRLKPDLVVLDTVQAKVVRGLGAAGIPTLTLPMRTLADVRAAMEKVGRAVGRPARAKALVRKLDGAVAAARARAAKRTGPHPRVLLVVDRQPGGLAGLVAAGPGSYLDALARIVGATNALAVDAKYAKISPAKVMEAAPDVILDAVHTDDRDAARKDWNVLSKVPAVAHGRVYMLSAEYYISPGPRAPLAIRGLEKILYGDKAR